MGDLGEPHPSQGGNDKPPKRDWEAVRKERFFDLKFSHYVEIVLTAALVGIAFFQYTVYSRQAGIMQSQANIAQTQNRIAIESDRAYLTIGDISFIENPPTAKPNGLDLFIVIKNTGKHVAEITSINVEPAIGFPNPVFREFPTYRTPNASLTAPPIVPGGETRIVGFAEQPPNAPIGGDALIKGLLGGSIPFWVYGVVTYDIGYPRMPPGELGFCAKFLTEAERRNGALPQFETCGGEQRKYTYTR